MYRVIEAAEILGVSKVTIYKKIELLKPEITNFIVNEEGVLFIGDKGIKLIKSSLTRGQSSKKKDRAQLKIVDLNCEIEELNQKIEELKKENEKIRIETQEDSLLNSKYLSTIAVVKKEELRHLQTMCEKLRMQIEEASELISKLKAIDKGGL